jgi:hypothetical protein
VNQPRAADFVPRPAHREAYGDSLARSLHLAAPEEAAPLKVSTG